MKKILLISILCLIPSICFAAETVEINLGNNYIVTTENTVTKTIPSNPDIITITPFFTIFNEKNILLLHPKKIGKSNLTIIQDKKETVFVVVVKSKKAKIPVNFEKSGFSFSLLDEPPDQPPEQEPLELDPPPLFNKGGK